jgi:hypothetical protein
VPVRRIRPPTCDKDGGEHHALSDDGDPRTREQDVEHERRCAPEGNLCDGASERFDAQQSVRCLPHPENRGGGEDRGRDHYGLDLEHGYSVIERVSDRMRDSPQSRTGEKLGSAPPSRARLQPGASVPGCSTGRPVVPAGDRPTRLRDADVAASLLSGCGGAPATSIPPPAGRRARRPRCLHRARRSHSRPETPRTRSSRRRRRRPERSPCGRAGDVPPPAAIIHAHRSPSITTRVRSRHRQTPSRQ